MATSQNGGYRVNDDGTVTRISGNNNSSNNSGNQNPNNNSGNDSNGCLWFIVIAVIIAIISFIKSANDSNNQIAQSDTSEVVEEAVEQPSFDNYNYNSNSSYQPAYSDACTLRRMDQTFNGYMLIPNFLTNYSVDENGWIIYSNNKGAYITSAIFEYYGTAYQYISGLSQGLNSLYSAHKDNWAVDSGLFENQIYYMKAVKLNDKIYCAIFVVPRGDKPNENLYQNLTKDIFKKSNFPTW